MTPIITAEEARLRNLTRASEALGLVLEFMAATRGEIRRRSFPNDAVRLESLAREFEMVGRCAFLLATELKPTVDWPDKKQAGLKSSSAGP